MKSLWVFDEQWKLIDLAKANIIDVIVIDEDEDIWGIYVTGMHLHCRIYQGSQTACITIQIAIGKQLEAVDVGQIPQVVSKRAESLEA